jgi:hypothetical protein
MTTLIDKDACDGFIPFYPISRGRGNGPPNQGDFWSARPMMRLLHNASGLADRRVMLQSRTREMSGPPTWISTPGGLEPWDVQEVAMPHDVLICHTPQDATIAVCLQKALRRAKWSAQLWATDRSEDGQSDAEPEHLDSQAVVFIDSQHAARSPEMAWKIGREAGRERRLILYRTENREVLSALQPLLADALWIDAWHDPMGPETVSTLLSGLRRRLADTGNSEKNTPLETEPLVLPEHRPTRPPPREPAAGQPAADGVNHQGERAHRWLGRIRPGQSARPTRAGITRGHSWTGWALSLVLHGACLGLLGWTLIPVDPEKRPEFDTTLGTNRESSGLTTGLEEFDPPWTPLDPGQPSSDDAPVIATFELPAPGIEWTSESRPAPTQVARRGGARGTEGFGESLMTRGIETIRGVKVQTGDPQFTLIWDSQVDLDLHVIEPGGTHISWMNKGQTTPHGGSLDVDNFKGFGPENVYWAHGQGPPGEYRWYVEYYGAFGGRDVPTRWQVRLKHDGQERIVEGRFRKIGERSKLQSLRVGTETARK